MRKQRLTIGAIAACCAMLVLILDAKTAVSAAQEGVRLCIYTVIPSLFPFFVLSGVVNSYLIGRHIALLRPIRMLCRIPEGSESLLLLGFIAGYPVGAQLIAQSCNEGKLSSSSAKRMLGFCNNAGPAFLFGMLSPLFANPFAIWFLWGIHVVSALLTAWVLPGGESDECSIKPVETTTLTKSLQTAIRTMGGVCGWVVIFRVILGFVSRWFLWWLPAELQVLLSGIMELANGCILLQRIPNEAMRFLLAGTMVAFGGLCVGMQTITVTQRIGTGYYFPGKVLQTSFSVLCSLLLQPIIYSNALDLPVSVLIIVVTMAIIAICCVHRKKVVAFRRTLLYNTGN